jgi:hypothetical protein
MPPMNSKNYAISPAATDLGLGDMLSTQLEGETEEAKRKRLLQQQRQASPAVMSLFGGLGGLGSGT